MAFGISQSVRSRGVQVCTPELFHQATRSSRVKGVCAQIEDALERKRRGEISQEDYDTMKTQLKSQLPILTPHATFKNGRRLNADAIPSGLSIYDKDHIPDPRGYWEAKKKVLAEKKLPFVDTADCKSAERLAAVLDSESAERQTSVLEERPTSVLDLIVLVHVTPSTEGLRLVFIIPEGMNLAEAQKWMSEQLEDEDYDVCVKDLARPSFIVPEDYILYINEAELFMERKNPPQISQINTDFNSSSNPSRNQNQARNQTFNPSHNQNQSLNPSHNQNQSLNPSHNQNQSLYPSHNQNQSLYPSHNQPFNSSKNNVETTRFSGTDSHSAVPVGVAIQPAQPSDSHDIDALHLSPAGGNQYSSGQMKNAQASLAGDCKSPGTPSGGTSQNFTSPTAGDCKSPERLTDANDSKSLNQGGLHRTNNRNSVASSTTGEGFDAPPTLERSGSERRGGAVTSPSPEERGLGGEVEPSLAKEGRGGSKESPSSELETKGQVGDYKSPPTPCGGNASPCGGNASPCGGNASTSGENASPCGETSPSGEKRVKGENFPSDYNGIPYSSLIAKLVELLGGAPQHGSRNSFIFTLSCYLRYLCDDNPAWIKQLIPTFGEEPTRAFTTVDSACNRKQASRMPAIVRKAISLCQAEQARGRATDYDTDDFGDIQNPDSYFYRIHEMPKKLPKLIKLLISRTPSLYQPAVSQAIFPSLASHLCDIRFRYIDNVEHEATLMSILCAPTGSGKECITQPINHIMSDIRLRDAEQRARERAWKDECNSKGANKDKRDRPEGLVIQEVNIDMTNPAFVLRMKEAENHFLYAKVNELNLFDSLKGKTNQHFRIMELAFDTGNYGQDRVGVQSVTETVKVRFNWNACCTPKKCRDYFRRVVTDGPISRISFATIERRPCGSAMPIYGTYDAAFDEELRPYIDNLVKARGLVDCPQAMRLAKKLVEENAEFARLSQNYVFENLSFRANVIAYLKACVLYVANGMKWEKPIEDFIRWSERYDLWCKLKLFGQMIYDADGEQDKVSKTAPGGPKNLLTLLPDEFTEEDYVKVRRAEGFDYDNQKRIKDALKQWVHRGYVVKMESGDGIDGSDGSASRSGDGDSDRPIFRKLKFLKH